MIKTFKYLFKRTPVLINPKEGYELWSQSYNDEQNPVRKLSIDSLNQLMPNLINARVLDIGCGTGYFSRAAFKQQAQNVVGIDLSFGMVEKARTCSADSQLCFINGNAEYLPFSNESFDVIICSLVLAHLPSIRLSMSEMSRVLKSDGIILIADFHPFCTLQGAKRTFRDPGTHKLFEIAHSIHLFESYFQFTRTNNLVIEDIVEPLYDGMPLVFAMKIKKQ